MRLPSNGGGTLNLPDEGGGEPGPSSIGVFGGLGGGGGPAFAELVARLLDGSAGVGREGSWFANLPASAIGGGALKRGLGGDGARGGLGDRLGGLWTAGAAGVADFLGGGGAGGGPRLDVPPEEPVFCGLKFAATGDGALGGGGGGAFAALSLFSASAAAVALCCSR